MQPKASTAAPRGAIGRLEPELDCSSVVDALTAPGFRTMSGDLYDPTEFNSEDEPPPRRRFLALGFAGVACFAITLAACLSAMAIDITGGVGPNTTTRIAMLWDPPARAQTNDQFDLAAVDDWFDEAPLPPSAPAAATPPRMSAAVVYEPGQSIMEAGPVELSGAAIDRLDADPPPYDPGEWSPADDHPDYDPSYEEPIGDYY